MQVSEENKRKFLVMLQNLARAIRSEVEKCGEVCGGINEKELAVVGIVGQNRIVKMTEIADKTQSPMSTLTNIVDKLVEKGLLIREHSSEDRRAINVTLSRTGQTAFESLISQKMLTAEELLSEYSEEEQNKFLSYLDRLAASLGKK
jgi:DNA-binding MarR family transcriptional regulator